MCPICGKARRVAGWEMSPLVRGGLLLLGTGRTLPPTREWKAPKTAVHS